MPLFSKIKGSLCAVLAVLLCGLIVGCQSSERGPAPTGTQPPPPPPGSTSSGTPWMPIYIGGGATTFYLNESLDGKTLTADLRGTKVTHKDWVPSIQATTTSFCAAEPQPFKVLLKGFTAPGGKVASDPLINFDREWMIELKTEQNRSVYVSYGNGACGDYKGQRIEVSLVPPGSSQRTAPPGLGFYSQELRGVRHDRRLKVSDPSCTDEDSCERIASLKYKDTTYDCDDRNCRVHLNLN